MLLLLSHQTKSRGPFFLVIPWSNGYRCEFHDRGSIPTMYQIADADLEKVG